MLKTRIITAVILLAVLLPVLFLNNYPAFAIIVCASFTATRQLARSARSSERFSTSSNF